MTKVVKIPNHDSGNTIFHITEKYLSERYKFRFNTASKEIQVLSTDKGAAWQSLNENSLYIELQKTGIRCNLNNLMAILKSDFTTHFDPLAEYFSNLKPWTINEGSHIAKLCSYIIATQPAQFQTTLRKWLIRAVKCALLPEYFNKQALILFQEQQDSGKSTFCRWLCPPALSDYFAEDISDDKDSRIMLTTNFIINLDELASLHRKEINNLKSMFSKDKINARLPYDRKSSVINRTCSFVGSTNLLEFLSDETGSVRWLCFHLKKINWAYKTDIDINDIWREAYTLHLEGFDCGLSAADIQENEQRNTKFQSRSQEFEAIQKYFEIPSQNKQGSFYTATDVMQQLSLHTSLKLNRTMVGRAINALRFPKARQGDRYGYDMIFNKPDYTSNEK